MIDLKSGGEVEGPMKRLRGIVDHGPHRFRPGSKMIRGRGRDDQRQGARLVLAGVGGWVTLDKMRIKPAKRGILGRTTIQGNDDKLKILQLRGGYNKDKSNELIYF